MKIELTQKELLSIVRNHYNIANTVDLEVTVGQSCTEVKGVSKTKTAEETVEDDVSDLLTDISTKKSRKAGRHKKRKYVPAGQGVITVPKNPKIDYTIYGESIENFLNSGQDFTTLSLDEGLTNTGMLHRYRTAAEMFGFRNRISLNAPKHRNILVISLPGKAPKGRPSAKVDSTIPKAYIK